MLEFFLLLLDALKEQKFPIDNIKKKIRVYICESDKSS